MKIIVDEKEKKNIKDIEFGSVIRHKNSYHIVVNLLKTDIMVPIVDLSNGFQQVLPFGVMVEVVDAVLRI